MTDLVFLDTETTGLDLLGHEIWEVGAIIREQRADGTYAKDVERAWQIRVTLGNADARALTLNRYHERQSFEDSYTARQFAEDFEQWTRGALLIVNNVSFDVPRLELLLRANGECPLWHYHPVDVRDYAAGAIRGYDSEAEALKSLPWSGSAIFEYFHIEKEHSEVHTALGDARTVRDLWDRVNV